VACGDTHTLVTTDDGVLYAFGRNQNGQLGLGTNDDALLPRVVESLKASAFRNEAFHRFFMVPSAPPQP
jgi:alpha-tubulin suppressor-like RCC1 family protein